MSDSAIEQEEEIYDDYALDQIGEEYQEALYYIEEFKAIVKNEDNYADLLLAEARIIECQEVYVNYKHNSTNELKTKMENLETIIIDMSKKMQEQLATISISDKKMITVKDFEMVYSINEEAQRKFRNKMKDPLPYIQLVERGNVLYDCKEVEKWFENYKN